MTRCWMTYLCGILLAVVPPSCAPAEEPSRYYFDHGAEKFTRDDLEKARAWVNEGLLLYPEDAKLILLKQLLEQPTQPQPQPSQDSKEPSQSDSQSSAEQQPQPIDNADQSERQAGEEDANDAQAPESARMTEEEAERILDALKDREAAERARAAADRLRREMSRLPPVEKDW